MNTSQEEQTVRYVDGDLIGEELTGFERLLERAPDLRALVDDHARLRSAITRAFGPAPDEHDLADIAARVEGTNVLPLPPRHGARRPGSWKLASRPTASAAAMAASLAVGILGGWMLHGSNRTALFNDENHQVAAAGILERTLTRSLASETANGPVRIGLSFASRQAICRTFSLNSGMDGLACRNRDKWIVQALVNGPNSRTATQFRLAASDTAPEIMSTVDRMIEGQPFDAASERRARDTAWKEGIKSER